MYRSTISDVFGRQPREFVEDDQEEIAKHANQNGRSDRDLNSAGANVKHHESHPGMPNNGAYLLMLKGKCLQ